MNLSERVEAAEGPSRELFREAYQAVFPSLKSKDHSREECEASDLRAFRFFRMLDAEAWTSAAEMLVPEGWSTGLGDLHGYDPVVWRAHLRDHNNPDPTRRQWVEGHASTRAPALAAAALRARDL